jgi:Uncharacterised nucleotidyltransferase
MWNRLQTLNTLCACLRGEVPTKIDWLATIALANESLTITNLAASVLTPRLNGDLPEDVRIFLKDVLSRNAKRNEMLLSQMLDSIHALNLAGIEPMLLKGSAILAAHPSTENAERMVSDVDLLVKDKELLPAINCLESAGYVVFDKSGDPGGPVTLARQCDVGMVDIHTKLRGPQALSASQELYATCHRVTIGAASYLVPSPTFQLLHFVLHDQFHSRDYWRGSVDLRHLCDLVKIVTQHEIDWILLQTHFSSRTSAAALSSQMIQLNKFLGVPIPENLSHNLLARFQYRRILTQMRYPPLRMPFICLTVLMGLNHRNRDKIKYDVSFQQRISGKLRGIRRMFSSTSMGKF